MAVIVNSDTSSLDVALRMLWRESFTRENIINTLKARRYYVKPSVEGHTKRRALKKTKTRRARMNRRMRAKTM